MRRARPIFRVARLVLTLAALCGACAQGIATVESPPPPKEEAATPKIPLPPEMEAKLKEFLDKAKVEKGKVWDARMKKEIDNVAGVTGLGDEGKKALEPAAKQAVETSFDGWSTKFNDWIREILIQQQPAQASMILDQWLTNVAAMVAQEDWYLDIIQPFEQEDWIKALHQTLTPAQAAAWDKTQAARKEDLEKQIGDTLKSGVEKIHEQQTQDMLSECKEIELAAGLPRERADKLEALAKTVVDQTTEMWRKRAERRFLMMGDDLRLQFNRNLGDIIFSTGQDENVLPDRQTAWKEGVAGLLTAEEATRLQAARNARKSKRAHVMGEILLMLLDEKIAFTAKQRLQLQPIADRLVQDVPELFPDNNGVNTLGQYQYNPAMFFAAAGKATEAELKPILDDIQRKHWRHLSEPEDAVTDTPDDGKSKPEENGEPVDVEKVISNFFYEKTENERKLLLAENILKAEDAARAAGLNAETTARLQLAAQGTTEESLAGWKWVIEEQVRSQLQDVTPQNVKQRLAGLSAFLFQQNFMQNFQQNNPMANRQEDVLEKTVQVELTAAQQESWRKETDAREAFRRQAIASLIVAEFDRKNQLTAEQWGKLEPIIEGILRDYSPEISRMFPSNAVAWYFEPWLLMPFSGVPEADLKAILSKDQLDRWSGSPEYANACNLWQNVQQQHNALQQQHNQQINQAQGQGQAVKALPLNPIKTVPPK